MEYRISIPAYIWNKEDAAFKSYVLSYLNKNEPEMKPVRVVRGKFIVCVKKEER
ncbi:MAG: hypothetical protein ABF969_04075 [Sporolactobacillus sp.]